MNRFARIVFWPFIAFDQWRDRQSDRYVRRVRRRVAEEFAKQASQDHGADEGNRNEEPIPFAVCLKKIDDGRRWKMVIRPMTPGSEGGFREFEDPMHIETLIYATNEDDAGHMAVVRACFRRGDAMEVIR